MNQKDEAVKAYKNFVNDEKSNTDKASLIHAYLYLANHYSELKQFEEATGFAQKVLELDETKAEAKSILKALANKRSNRQPKDDMEEAIMDLERTAEHIQSEDMDMSS
jgi:tetratricopeptide (TPR) repeat protein